MRINNLTNICRWYAAIVSATAIFTLLVMVVSYQHIVSYRGYEDVLARAGALAMGANFISVVIGGSLLTAHVRSNIEPPPILDNLVLAAIVLFVIALFGIPIQHVA